PGSTGKNGIVTERSAQLSGKRKHFSPFMGTGSVPGEMFKEIKIILPFILDGFCFVIAMSKVKNPSLFVK
ncbi:hypothetical protein, partial [Chryseobacterium sp. SIMBA_028]|uniref:hypothetical protein n=1 Tax=Chryseobacterium sp. SIMBA_028 TaxID=3085771 RepID=UPI00397C94EC